MAKKRGNQRIYSLDLINVGNNDGLKRLCQLVTGFSNCGTFNLRGVEQEAWLSWLCVLHLGGVQSRGHKRFGRSRKPVTEQGLLSVKFSRSRIAQ